MSILTSAEVMAKCRIGRTTLNNRTKEGSKGYDCDFPSSFKMGLRRNGWFSDEIDKYLMKKACRRTNLPE